MSQQINLLTPALRRKRQPVTLDTVAAALIITLLGLGGVHFYMDEKVGGLQEELQSAERLLKSQQDYVSRLKGEESKAMDGALAADIARLEGELRNGRQSIEALQSGGLGARTGFAEYFSAFARQATGGVWLTGFTIAPNELTVHGRVLQAEALPGYVERLKRERIFEGRRFAALEMQRPKAADEKSGPDGRPPLRYLEFTLTSGVIKPEQTAALPAKGAQP